MYTVLNDELARKLYNSVHSVLVNGCIIAKFETKQTLKSVNPTFEEISLANWDTAYKAMKFYDKMVAKYRGSKNVVVLMNNETVLETSN